MIGSPARKAVVLLSCPNATIYTKFYRLLILVLYTYTVVVMQNGQRSDTWLQKPSGLKPISLVTTTKLPSVKSILTFTFPNTLRLVLVPLVLLMVPCCTILLNSQY